MCRIILITILALICFKTKAQDFEVVPKKNNTPKLILDFPLIDYQYINYAAKTVSGEKSPVFSNYLQSYSNPSMKQSLMMSSNLYNSVHYGLGKVEYHFFEKDRWNNLLETYTVLFADFILAYAPLGDGWLHEEYHRAVLTRHYTNSFNDMNKFPIGAESVSVSHVKDVCLENLKTKSNPDFVRMHTAGIEGEYNLIHHLQKQEFVNDQKINHLFLFWLSTIGAISYVRTCSQQYAEDFTTEINEKEGGNIKIRDFTGLDFCAYSYDLFRPGEAYSDRGIHPSGVGIDRYIKPSDLTGKELKFLKQQGNWQLINLVSPFLLGFEKMKLKKDKSNNSELSYFNFSLRDYLTPFGNDISGNFFLQKNKYNFIFSLHFYNNYNMTLPGIDAEIIDFPVKIKQAECILSVLAKTWLQPDNQEFMTTKAQPGGLLQARLELRNKKIIMPYFETEAKTAGWATGNVFLNKNISCRLGISCRFY